MKHLKEYEDLDAVFKDMQDLDLAKEYKGWWVYIDVPEMMIGYHAVISEDIGTAIIRVLDEIRFLSTREDKKKAEINRMYNEYDMDTFSDLEQILEDFYGSAGRSADVASWKMTLRPEYAKEGICVKAKHVHNLPEIIKVGQKYFSDFDKVLNTHPSGKD